MSADALTLTDADRDMLEGSGAEATADAMRIIVHMGRVAGARELVDVTGAHIDSCLFHGYAGLDFAERLRDAGGSVVVPTTLNVSSLDLLHPGLYRGDATIAVAARRLMDAYVAMGAKATWTCAPYQLAERPGFGEHIAWAESNAVVFANSVLGARTGRYGDFIDIAAAITGRVPLAGLHLTENRRARVVIDVSALPDMIRGDDVLYPLLGHLIGQLVGSTIPVIVGLESAVAEEHLKAIGAAAASSGSVAMFHVVGSTPEAPTLHDALQGQPPNRVIDIDAAMLTRARAQLTSGSSALTGVSIGTPHLSFAEFSTLVGLLRGRRCAEGIDFWVNTSRYVLGQVHAAGWSDVLDDFGVRVVTDTCTYITPILRSSEGTVMTNSGKWAYYAPANLGVDVAFGNLGECVSSAVAGRVVTDDHW